MRRDHGLLVLNLAILTVLQNTAIADAQIHGGELVQTTTLASDPPFIPPVAFPAGATFDHNVDPLTGSIALSIPLMAVSDSLEQYNVAIRYGSSTATRDLQVSNSEYQAGILGVGWSIGDVDVIRRDTRSTATQTDDRFFLNGQELTLKARNLAQGFEQYQIRDTYSNNRIVRAISPTGVSTWTVTDADGATKRYGGNTGIEDGAQAAANTALAQACSILKNSTPAIGTCKTGPVEYSVIWENWIGTSEVGATQSNLELAWNLAESTNARGQSIIYSYVQDVQQVGTQSGAKNFTKASYLYRVTLPSGQHVDYWYCSRAQGASIGSETARSQPISSDTSMLGFNADKANSEQPQQTIGWGGDCGNTLGKRYADVVDPWSMNQEPDGYQERMKTLYLGSIGLFTGTATSNLPIKRANFTYVFQAPGDDAAMAKRQLVSIQAQDLDRLDADGRYISSEPPTTLSYYGETDNVTVARSGATGANNEDLAINATTGALYGALKSVQYPAGNKIRYKYQKSEISSVKLSASLPEQSTKRQVLYGPDYALVMWHDKSDVAHASVYSWTQVGWMRNDLTSIPDPKCNSAGCDGVLLTARYLAYISDAGKVIVLPFQPASGKSTFSEAVLPNFDGRPLKIVANDHVLAINASSGGTNRTLSYDISNIEAVSGNLAPRNTYESFADGTLLASGPDYLVGYVEGQKTLNFTESNAGDNDRFSSLKIDGEIKSSQYCYDDQEMDYELSGHERCERLSGQASALSVRDNFAVVAMKGTVLETWNAIGDNTYINFANKPLLFRIAVGKDNPIEYMDAYSGLTSKISANESYTLSNHSYSWGFTEYGINWALQFSARSEYRWQSDLYGAVCGLIPEGSSQVFQVKSASSRENVSQCAAGSFVHSLGNITTTTNGSGQRTIWLYDAAQKKWIDSGNLAARSVSTYTETTAQIGLEVTQDVFGALMITAGLVSGDLPAIAFTAFGLGLEIASQELASQTNVSSLNSVGFSERFVRDRDVMWYITNGGSVVALAGDAYGRGAVLKDLGDRMSLYGAQFNLGTGYIVFSILAADDKIVRTYTRSLRNGGLGHPQEVQVSTGQTVSDADEDQLTVGGSIYLTYAPPIDGKRNLFASTAAWSLHKYVVENGTDSPSGYTVSSVEELGTGTIEEQAASYSFQYDVSQAAWLGGPVFGKTEIAVGPNASGGKTVVQHFTGREPASDKVVSTSGDNVPPVNYVNAVSGLEYLRSIYSADGNLISERKRRFSISSAVSSPLDTFDLAQAEKFPTRAKMTALLNEETNTYRGKTRSTTYSYNQLQQVSSVRTQDFVSVPFGNSLFTARSFQLDINYVWQYVTPVDTNVSQFIKGNGINLIAKREFSQGDEMGGLHKTDRRTISYSLTAVAGTEVWLPQCNYQAISAEVTQYPPTILHDGQGCMSDNTQWELTWAVKERDVQTGEPVHLTFGTDRPDRVEMFTADRTLSLASFLNVGRDQIFYGGAEVYEPSENQLAGLNVTERDAAFGERSYAVDTEDWKVGIASFVQPAPSRYYTIGAWINIPYAGAGCRISGNNLSLGEQKMSPKTSMNWEYVEVIFEPDEIQSADFTCDKGILLDDVRITPTDTIWAAIILDWDTKQHVGVVGPQSTNRVALLDRVGHIRTTVTKAPDGKQLAGMAPLSLSGWSRFGGFGYEPNYQVERTTLGDTSNRVPNASSRLDFASDIALHLRLDPGVVALPDSQSFAIYGEIVGLVQYPASLSLSAKDGTQQLQIEITRGAIEGSQVLRVSDPENNRPIASVNLSRDARELAAAVVDGAIFVWIDGNLIVSAANAIAKGDGIDMATLSNMSLVNVVVGGAPIIKQEYFSAKGRRLQSTSLRIDTNGLIAQRSSGLIYDSWGYPTYVKTFDPTTAGCTSFRPAVSLLGYCAEMVTDYDWTGNAGGAMEGAATEYWAGASPGETGVVPSTEADSAFVYKRLIPEPSPLAEPLASKAYFGQPTDRGIVATHLIDDIGTKGWLANIGVDPIDSNFDVTTSVTSAGDTLSFLDQLASDPAGQFSAWSRSEISYVDGRQGNVATVGAVEYASYEGRRRTETFVFPNEVAQRSNGETDQFSMRGVKTYLDYAGRVAVISNPDMAKSGLAITNRNGQPILSCDDTTDPSNCVYSKYDNYGRLVEMGVAHGLTGSPLELQEQLRTTGIEPQSAALEFCPVQFWFYDVEFDLKVALARWSKDGMTTWRIPRSGSLGAAGRQFASVKLRSGSDIDCSQVPDDVIVNYSNYDFLGRRTISGMIAQGDDSAFWNSARTYNNIGQVTSLTYPSRSVDQQSETGAEQARLNYSYSPVDGLLTGLNLSFVDVDDPVSTSTEARQSATILDDVQYTTEGLISTFNLLSGRFKGIYRYDLQSRLVSTVMDVASLNTDGTPGAVGESVRQQLTYGDVRLGSGDLLLSATYDRPNGLWVEKFDYDFMRRLRTVEQSIDFSDQGKFTNWTFDYDENGNLVSSARNSAIGPDVTQRWTYAVLPNGSRTNSLRTFDDSEGSAIDFQYNDRASVEGITLSDGRSVQLERDLVTDSVLKIVSASQTVTKYDAYGNLWSEISENKSDQRFGLDEMTLVEKTRKLAESSEEVIHNAFLPAFGATLRIIDADTEPRKFLVLLTDTTSSVRDVFSVGKSTARELSVDYSPFGLPSFADKQGIPLQLDDYDEDPLNQGFMFRGGRMMSDIGGYRFGPRLYNWSTGRFLERGNSNSLTSYQ